jgi:hypothetical protein
MSTVKLLALNSILLIALMAACGPREMEPGAAEPAATANPEATKSPAESPASEATELEGTADAPTSTAVAQLASELGVAEAEINVVSAEAAEFTDSCLGLGQLNESCLQAITPGWLLVLAAEGQQYEVHTDVSGEQVRITTDPAP